MKRKIMMFLTLFLIGIGFATAQTQVRGTVVDDQNEPVIGATIQIKGDATRGTVTDGNGHFTLSAPANGTLVVSYVGMTTQEVAVKPSLRIVLVSDATMLDEVIAVAYGTTKRSSFTGSASSVSSKDLEIRPIANASQALSGIAPGVQVTSGGGQPGDGIAVRIRGFGSINASSAPLYVVDGAIYNGNLADINPVDIENMTILKDAASTSLYGSSAGNGVILITTKKGRAGKPSITFSTTQGTSQRGIPEYERVDIWNYYPAMWEQMKNNHLYNVKGNTPETAALFATNNIYRQLYYNPFKGIDNKQIVGTDGKLNPAATTLLYGDDLDWEKALTRKGYRSEYNVNYSSRNDMMDSYVSLGYLKEDGYSVKSNYERFSGRTTLNYQMTKWLKTGFNLSAFRTKSGYLPAGTDNNTSYVNPFFFSRYLGPIYPIYTHDDATGEYVLDLDGNKMFDFDKRRGTGASSGRHALAETLYNDRMSSRDGVNARTYMDFQLHKDLKFTVNVAYDNSNYNSTVYTNRIVGDARGLGRLAKTNTRSTTATFNQLLNYTKTLNNIHHIEALLGHESYYYKYNYNTATKGKQIVDNVYEFANFVTPEDMNSYTDSYNKEGYFGRLNYDYMNKYYGSFSYRYDGSSRFSREARWGNFWSAGASWRVSQEPFMKNVSWVDDLKVRASYGETGNDQVLDSGGNDAYYPYQTVYTLGWNNLDDPGILFSSFGNNALKWETQISYDVALEFSLFKRLKGTLEFFNKESKDLLFDVPLPVSVGRTSIWKNIGKIRNYGVEVELNLDLINDKNITWSVGTNATMLKNKILELPEGQQEIISGTKKIMVGHSMYDYWLKEYKGVDPKDGMALYKFDAENQTYSAADVRIIDGDSLTTNQSKAKYHYTGSSIPKLYGGFNTSLRYKDFTFGVVFAYQLGGTAYDNGYQSLMGMNSMGGALHTDAWTQSWKKEGDITNVPRLDMGQSTNFNATSDRWLVSSNALVLKTLSLSYNLPKTLISKVDISNARFTLSGENLHFWTARKGLNPMQNYAGTNSNIYSAARTFTVGLQVTF